MMRYLRAVAALATVMMVAACFSPGPQVQIPVTMPDGERATIYTHDQFWPDYLIATEELEFNFVVKGNLDPEDLKAVANIKGSCRIYTRDTRPNELVAVILNGVVYSIIGAPLGGWAATWAFKGARFDQYAKYTGVVAAGGGLANGIIQMGGKTYTFESCGREVLALFPKYGDHIRILMKSPY